MKHTLILIVLGLAFAQKGRAQTEDVWIIVTIKKESNGYHKELYDFWIAKQSALEEEQPFVPLYIVSFSQDDLNECCLRDTLVAFNNTRDENWDFEAEQQRAFESLLEIALEDSKKVLTVQKKWESYREKFIYSVVAVKGAFCGCEIVKSSSPTQPLFDSKILLPYSGFEVDPDFWSSPSFDIVKYFDFSQLDFTSLHFLQNNYLIIGN